MNESSVENGIFFAPQGAKPASKKVASLLRAENLTKVFRSGDSDLVVLDQLELNVEEGEMVAIVGESGSGKSTLLQILGALDKPTSGAIYFGREPYAGLSAAAMAAMRNRNFGFVWQSHFLLPEFSARENVEMPLRIRGTEGREAARRAGEWLDRVGLAARSSHRVGELSGGEQQRVALARALAGEPKVLLADEPTGSLDAGTAERTMQLMERLHREHHMTTLLVTHNLGLAQRCDRTLRLENGRAAAVSLSGTL